MSGLQRAVHAAAAPGLSPGHSSFGQRCPNGTDVSSLAHTGDTSPANAVDNVGDWVSYEVTTIWRDVPSGGALILPPLVVWEFERPGASITGVLLPTASRPKGKSFWKGCDSPGPLSSRCVDAVRPRDCLHVGRSREAPGWEGTG